MTDSAAGAGLWFALVFPSSFIVQKYFGWEATIAYAIAVAVIVAFLPGLTSSRIAKRHAIWLLLAAIAAATVAFLVIYPIANTHTPGAGSDDDDALNIATRALLAGRFPYAPRTYLGNAVHHLPGSFILAAPFVLAGTSAFQNIFWLTAFVAAVSKDRGVERGALLWLVLALSPGVMWEIVTGTGYVSNAISVALGLWWLARTRHKEIAAFAWGITLATRANFAFLVPIAFAYLGRQAGWKTALRATALTCGTFLCLTLPFYLHDPAGFTPLEGANRLLVFDALMPHLGAALMVVMAGLAAGLSLTRMDEAALFRNCALVQAFPIVAGVLLSTFRDGHVNLTYARYGALFAWFAFIALLTAGQGSADNRVLKQAQT